MNADIFSYYLVDTSKLRELGYQDLQNLIAKFPYCQNLRFLIAKKSQLEDHPDFEKWLNLAATYSTDRSYLYQLLHDMDFTKDYEFEETSTDLSAINEVQNTNFLLEDLEKISVAMPQEIKIDHEERLIEQAIAEKKVEGKKEIQPIQEEYNDDAPLITLEDLLSDKNEDTIIFEEKKDAEQKAESEENIESESLITLSDLLGEEKTEEKVIPIPSESAENADKVATSTPTKPMPKSAFSSWNKKKGAATASVGAGAISLINETELAEYKHRIEEKMLDEPSRKKKKQKNEDPKAFADKSLILNENLMSATLANILGEQGRKNEAIAMYNKLKLQIPEKSTFFAAEIEKLKS